MASPILIISGTNRPGSNAMRVARVLLGHYMALGAAAEIYSLTDLPPAIFDGAAYKTKPDAFVPVQQRVLAAPGLHVVTPEYNGSFPGVLKYFVDMLKFPESFERKPVAFVGEANGMFGALRAVEQLQLIFGYRNAHIYPERVFIPDVKNRFDAEGRLIDVAIDGRLEKQVRGFASFIGCISAAPPLGPVTP